MQLSQILFSQGFGTRRECDALVLAGFNQPYKISAQVFDVWCVLLAALPRLRDAAPRARILVLTSMPEDLYAERCLRAGADGFVPKSSLSATLLEAVRTVLGRSSADSTWRTPRRTTS